MQRWTDRKETTMKHSRATSLSVAALSMALGLVPLACGRVGARGTLSHAAHVQGGTAAAPPAVEKQRKDLEQQAERSLDQDAATAVEETVKAAHAIDRDRPADALAAIERATGKINVLLARNPAAALVPVRAEVEVIDAAPADLQAIKQLDGALEKVVRDRDYPQARLVLLGLTSEIHLRTENLPLGTYPAALKDAARLLDQKKHAEARAVLGTALHTLVVIDRSTPLPLLFAQGAIDDAEALRTKDPEGARKLVATARNELERAQALGYASNDPEYAALDGALGDLDKQLQGHEDTGSAFTRLKERVSAFFKRQSAAERR
jgi:YfdX protein